MQGAGLEHFAENIYGHGKRLSWILSRIRRSDVVLELGCGTGVMITIPLARMGYKVYGIDPDEKSIAFGRELCREAGVAPEILTVGNIPGEGVIPDVIIASEVLEHLRDDELAALLAALGRTLWKGGILLVTVPNGYGWFELESWLWYRVGLGKALESLRLDRSIRKLKRILLGDGVDAHHHDTPSTFSSSPHVQRFTLRSIRRVLARHGFEVVEVQGAVMFSGPFSNLLFTGVRPIMAFNSALGGRFPGLASNYYLGCRQIHESR